MADGDAFGVTLSALCTGLVYKTRRLTQVPDLLSLAFDVSMAGVFSVSTYR